MRVWLLAFLLLGLGLKGQERQVIPIETFPINAKVLFTLQGTDDRAVLRVEKVDPNPYGIEIGDTLLFTFYWSTQAIKSDLATFPGIGAGDEISVRISVKRSPLNGSYQYTAYHYKNRSRLRSAANRQEALTNDESPK